MDKWLNLDRRGKNIDDNVAESLLPGCSMPKVTRKRKYVESFLQYGFTSTNDNGLKKTSLLNL